MKFPKSLIVIFILGLLISAVPLSRVTTSRNTSAQNINFNVQQVKSEKIKYPGLGINASRNYNVKTLVMSNDTLINSSYCNHGNIRNPYASVFDPQNGLIYEAKYLSSQICEISAKNKKILGSIYAGTEVTSLIYCKANSQIYASSICGNVVNVINTTNEKYTKTIFAGYSICALALCNSDRTLYTFNALSRNITVISTLSNRAIGSIQTKHGLTNGIVFQNGGCVAGYSETSDIICLINTKTNNVSKAFSTSAKIDGIAVDPTNGSVYFSSVSNSVIILNKTTGNTSTVCFTYNGNLQYCKEDRTMYMADSNLNEFLIFNPLNFDIARITSVIGFPESFSFDNISNLVYVNNYLSCTISVLNLSTLSCISTISTTFSPNSVVFSPLGSNLVVAQKYSKYLLELNPKNYDIVGKIESEACSFELAVNPYSNFIYDLLQTVSTLLVFNPNNLSQRECIPLNGSPDSITFNPENGSAFIAIYNKCQVEELSNFVPGKNSSVISIFDSIGAPSSVVFNVQNKFLYVAECTSNEILKINTENKKTSKSYTKAPHSIELSQDGQLLYINNDSRSITITNLTTCTNSEISNIPYVGNQLFYSASNGYIYYLSYNNKLIVFRRNDAQPSCVLNVSLNSQCLAFIPTSGSFVLSDTSHGTLEILSPKVMYKITVTETGLSGKTSWFFNLTGVFDSSPIKISTSSFQAPNGTYLYTAQVSNKIFNSSTKGKIIINGNGTIIHLVFRINKYRQNLKEIGLPVGCKWDLSVNSSLSSSSGNTIELNLANGTYEVLASTNGNLYSSSPIIFTVDGKSQTIDLDFYSTSTGSHPVSSNSNIYFFLTGISVLLILLGYYVYRRKR